MSRVKVYSVKLKSLTEISPKCYKATDFNGNTCFISKSNICGEDYSVYKSGTYWIPAWVLERSPLSYSCKKVGWYNPITEKVYENTIVTHIVPDEIEPIKIDPDETLIR